MCSSQLMNELKAAFQFNVITFDDMARVLSDFWNMSENPGTW